MLLSLANSQLARLRLDAYKSSFHTGGVKKRSPKRECFMKQVGSVKWFDPVKGFGFVVLRDGRDALLHGNVIKAHDAMAVNVLKGSIIECDVTEGDKGLHVTSIESITPPEVQGFVPGKVKWFNIAKGFGFVVVNGADIFIHAEVVKAACMADLVPDQNLLVMIADNQRGKRVCDVRPA